MAPYLRKNSVPVLILLAGMAVAAGIFVFFDFNAAGQNAAAATPQWTQEAGAAVSAPACASLNSPSTTCVDGVAQATISWIDPFGHGAAVNLDVCKGGWCPTIVYTPAGMFNPAGWDWFTLPAAGSVTLTPLENNTTYTYAFRDTQGTVVGYPTFTTPNCASLSASCSVSPTSASTGETVTWSAQASAGDTLLAQNWEPYNTNAGWAGFPPDGMLLARRFTASASYPIGRVALNTTREATVTGNFWVTIETDAGGFPSGTVLGTSGVVNQASFCQHVCYDWADDFYFSSGVPITSGTRYWIVLRGSNLAGSNPEGYPLTVLPLARSGDPDAGKKSLVRQYTNPSVWTDTTGSYDIDYRVYSYVYAYSWSGTDGLSGTTQSVQKSYSSPGTKSGSVTVTSGSQTVTQSCGNSVQVSPQTLSVALSANPSSGTAPLNGVDLTATVSGTAQGAINYTFYCDRSDSGTDITSGWAAKYDNTQDNPKTAVDVCNYSSGGTYTAKVIVERGSAPAAEARQTINVNYPSLSASCSVSPTSASTGQNVTWSASASGGTGSYSYSWSGDSPLQGQTGNPATVSYSSAGTKNGSVTVTSGSQTAGPVSCSSSVQVTQPPVTINSFIGTSGSQSGTTITVNAGANVTLSWSTTNATSCSINQGIGSVPISGSTDTSPTATTTYTLTCTGPGGSGSANITVNVSSPPRFREIPPE